MLPVALGEGRTRGSPAAPLLQSFHSAAGSLLGKGQVHAWVGLQKLVQQQVQAVQGRAKAIQQDAARRATVAAERAAKSEQVC
jgi:hypothetical protein